MAQPTDPHRPAASDPAVNQLGSTRVDVQHRLPSGKSPVQRITDQSKGLVDDLKAWVELRIQLVKAEVRQEVKAKAEEILLQVIAVVVAAIGGLFLLVTLALFIGWALGHPAWGFLIVTVLLFLVAAIVKAVGDRKARAHQARSAGEVDAS